MAEACGCSSLSTCGCCEGITQETPQVIDNRPGLSAIAYRTGTYTQFYETLQARISQSRLPNLRALQSRDPNDFTIALFDAFSVMADVLTFYTERIANESYLGTATERTSVRQLANLVGYRMSPGVSASAYLAFTIDPTAGAFGTVLASPAVAQVLPELVPSVLVPAGTRVQSIPGPGETPQTFETSAQISARSEWNAIQPRMTQPQTIVTSASAVLLSGNITNLKNGDRLLLIPSSGAAEGLPVKSVSVSADGKTTEVDIAWTPPPPPVYSPAASSYIDDPASGAVALTMGLLVDLQKLADMPSAAAALSVATSWWDAGDIVAAAQTNQWPLDQLSSLVNQQVASAASGSVAIFRQQAAPFGYNAPNYYSLPPALTQPSAFAQASTNSSGVVSTTQIEIPAAYSQPWDVAPGTVGESPFTLDQWGNNNLYLDSLYPQIVAGSYVMLTNDTTGTQLIASVTSVSPVTHIQFSVTGKVTKLTVSPIGGISLSSFSLRDTIILCQSEIQSLAQVPVSTNVGEATTTPVITLNGALLGLLSGQQIVLSGITLVSNGSGGYLTGPPAAEVRTLQDVVLAGGFTVITLDSVLDNVYQRSSIAINANVATATNGQSITEVLGNGDGTQAFQSFVLHQSPLTYVQADTISGSTSTLQVWVDSNLWTEVPFFYGHGSSEQIYITSQDDSGTTTIIFGDGITGSRLPTGAANVQAYYRSGIGTGGLVRGNQLSQMMTRPLGVRAVNNPLAATGAADPEDLNTGRTNATLAIMTLGRVVSLEDYQDFALAFVGIGKALATWTWNGQQRVVVLTVGGQTGPIDPSDSVLSRLPATIALNSDPGVQLFPFPYQAIYFKLSATVLISAPVQPADVLTAMTSVLRSTFGYSSRGFGQPVYQSEVVAAMQNIIGVVDVVVAIYLSADPTETPYTQLASSVPQTGGRNDIAPAQLLTLDPSPLDITLTMVTQ
jgi:hypothetical protein